MQYQINVDVTSYSAGGKKRANFNYNGSTEPDEEAGGAPHARCAQPGSCATNRCLTRPLLSHGGSLCAFGSMSPLPLGTAGALGGRSRIPYPTRPPPPPLVCSARDGRCRGGVAAV